MPRWEKLATDVGVGGVVGAVSKLAENYDANKVAKGQKMEFFGRAGNYVNYGVGLVALIGSFAGFLRGDWETRMLSIGGTLAGRQVAGELTKPKATAAWIPAYSSGPGPVALGAGVGAPSMGARAWRPTGIKA